MQDSLESPPIEEKNFLCQILIDIKKERSEKRLSNKALLIRLLTLKINQLDQFEELAGGYSNSTYHYKEEKLVLRFPKLHNPRYCPTSYASHASIEIHNLLKAKAFSLTPLEVVAYYTEYSLLVTQFIPSYQFCSKEYFKDTDKLTELANLVKKLHYSKLEFEENNETPFPFIDSSSKIFKTICSTLDEEDYKIIEQLQAIRSSVANFEIRKRPSHGDLHPFNLIEIGGVIQLIDWEFSSMRDPAYDISRFLCGSDLDPETEDFFLETYKDAFNIELSDSEFDYLKMRIQLFKPLIYFSTVVWAKYTVSFYDDKRELFEEVIKDFTAKTLSTIKKIDLSTINAKNYATSNLLTDSPPKPSFFKNTSENESTIASDTLSETSSHASVKKS